MPARGARLLTLGAAVATAALLARDGAASDREKPNVAYVVTFSALAKPQDIESFRARLGELTGGKVETSQVSPVTFTISVYGDGSPKAKATIADEMVRSPVVCVFCETGMGCLGTIMDKPGCR